MRHCLPILTLAHTRTRRLAVSPAGSGHAGYRPCWLAFLGHLHDGAAHPALEQLAEWLRGLSVGVVAMESSGVYWKPVFNILEVAGAAAEHARGMLVMSFPNSRWWTRLGLTLANFGFRVIRMQFRVFLHPPALILTTVEQHGFRTKLNERGLLWQVAVLERTAWSCSGVIAIRLPAASLPLVARPNSAS